MENKIKTLRKEKGLTQQELADEIGVTKRTIIAWENGERDIKPKKAQQLADEFGVSVAFLLGYNDDVEESEFSAWLTKIDNLLKKNPELNEVIKLYEERLIKEGRFVFSVYGGDNDALKLLLSDYLQEYGKLEEYTESELEKIETETYLALATLPMEWRYLFAQFLCLVADDKELVSNLISSLYEKNNRV